MVDYLKKLYCFFFFLKDFFILDFLINLFDDLSDFVIISVFIESERISNKFLLQPCCFCCFRMSVTTSFICVKLGHEIVFCLSIMRNYREQILIPCSMQVSVSKLVSHQLQKDYGSLPCKRNFECDFWFFFHTAKWLWIKWDYQAETVFFLKTLESLIMKKYLVPSMEWLNASIGSLSFFQFLSTAHV